MPDPKESLTARVLTVGSLFSGIGGLDLGLERAGMEVRWQVENDPYCNRVLAKHWSDVPRYGDIKELDPDDLEPVDVVAGGFPCQPVSQAGERKAQADERWLWPEFARLLRHLRPRYALMENVPGLFALGFADVLSDLHDLGFDAEWSVVSACGVGAPHLRERVFILAYPAGSGLEGLFEPQRDAQHRPVRDVRRDWPTEPDVARVADGIPRQLVIAPIRALGNAVVPQVAEYVGRCIVAFDAERAA